MYETVTTVDSNEAVVEIGETHVMISLTDVEIELSQTYVVYSSVTKVTTGKYEFEYGSVTVTHADTVSVTHVDNVGEKVSVTYETYSTTV
jgi:hypothetical protein